MKKFFSTPLLAGVIVLAMGLTAFAATTMFTDEGEFADWYSDSVKKMQYNEVITGYPDGSFKGGNNVSRAELAVMLDRFAANVFGKEMQSEPMMCTMQYVYGLTVYLQDQDGQPLSGATISSSPETEFMGVDGVYSGMGEGEGYYTFTVEKAGYSTYHETIKLEQNECHVISQTRTVTLYAL